MAAEFIGVSGNLDPILTHLTGIPLGVLVIVLALTSLFLAGYVIQGLRVGSQLWLAVRSIRRLAPSATPDNVARVLTREPFRHLWEEYSDTLHEVTPAGNPALPSPEIRATVPAEMFFTRDVLVDSRLFDDFTRHLPGVLTGLGIIGTFAGLLDGLGHFDATTSASAVAGLKPLLEGVAHAFITSAVSISCAMGVVFISKLVLATFYRQVERLNQTIDALYATGAGEEYLSRLVQASEKSDAHALRLSERSEAFAAGLKEALVDELNAHLTNLADRQIEAQSRSTLAIGQHIGATLAGSLAAPLEGIRKSLDASSQMSGQVMFDMQQKLLAGFMAKLEDTFVGQMRGIHGQMDRSMGALSSVHEALLRLVEHINRSNEHATNRLSGTLEDAMGQAVANQRHIMEEMKSFVREFRALLTEEQGKSKQVMDQALSGMLGKLTLAIDAMEATRQATAEQEASRHLALTQSTHSLVGELTAQVQTLTALVAQQLAQSQQTVEAIGATTRGAIEGMNAGAVTMASAAQRFETAGSAVAGVFQQSAQVAQHMTATAGTLERAAVTLREGVDHYDGTRAAVDASVASLTALIQNIRHEAGLSKAMLADLDRIVDQLRIAEGLSTQYLEGVNRTLAESFDAFGQALASQLKSTLGDTDRHLSHGVQQLNGVVQELGLAIGRSKRA